MSKLKYLILFFFLFTFNSCEFNKRDSKVITGSEKLIIPLNDRENFIYTKIGTGVINGEKCFFKFNTANGQLILIRTEDKNEILNLKIEDDGPQGFANFFFTDLKILDNRIFLVNGPSGKILSIDSKGQMEAFAKLPISSDEGLAYLFISEGNRVFHKIDDAIYLSVFNDFPKQISLKDPIFSVLKVNSIGEIDFFAPVPQYNIDNIWGNDHMTAGPFGLFSEVKNKFLVGHSNLSEVSVFDINGDLEDIIQLEIPGWENTQPFPIQPKDLENATNEMLIEIKSYGESQNKLWKFYEFPEGYLFELVHGSGDNFFPDFTVCKFDLEFNYISKKEFKNHANTFYKSFQLENGYYLFNQKAYENNENELVYDRFEFEDF